MSEFYIGLMSGTSLDGIDAVVADFSENIDLIHAVTLPFPDALHIALRELIDQPGAVALDIVGTLDAELGLAYSNAVQTLLKKSAVSHGEIRAIGCHGQTIRHNPGSPLPFTWQIGDPNRIAATTGLTVVADFRRMDMAVGGQGAPLVPAFHSAIFSREDERRVVVNIGGIANITRLGATLTGYDTGPGNGLMDAWIHHVSGKSFDRNGEWAMTGRVDEELLAAMSADPFFLQAPPRSTGREHFNLRWLQRHLSERTLAAEDVQATLLALTAESIAREVQRSQADRVLVCGGGARNTALIDALRVALGDTPLGVTDDYGLDADFVEAAAFAWLARERLAGRPGNIPSVTGAGRAVSLGAIYRP